MEQAQITVSVWNLSEGRKHNFGFDSLLRQARSSVQYSFSRGARTFFQGILTVWGVWLCSESSYLCTKKLNIVSRMKTRDKEKGCNWGRELRRMGAAVQLSVLGRGIPNTCLIIWVKYWVRILSAHLLFLWRLAVELSPSGSLSEGVAAFTPCGVEGSHLCSDGWQLFPSLQKGISLFQSSREFR